MRGRDASDNFAPVEECDPVANQWTKRAGMRMATPGNSSRRHALAASKVNGRICAFGVATSIEFGLHPVVSVTAGHIEYRLQDARAVLRFYREFMATAPDWFHADVSLNAKDRSAVVALCHTGNPNEGERLLGQFRSAAPPSRDNVKVQGYSEFCGAQPTPKPDETIPSECVVSQGVYLARLSDEVIELMLDRVAQAPGEALVASLGIGHFMHGQVCRTRPEVLVSAIARAGHADSDKRHLDRRSGSPA